MRVVNCHTCERELNQAVDRLLAGIQGDSLSWQEACAAIGRGECVAYESKDFGHCVFGPKGFWRIGSSIRWDDTTGMKGHHGFHIVPDPSKQVEPPPYLTYEQALECEKVRIEWPFISNEPIAFSIDDECANHTTLTRLEKGFHPNAALFLDLAERRGYRIKKVD